MSEFDTTNDRNLNDWDTCSPGELGKMVHRLDAQQRSVRRRQVLSTALVSTGVFACAVLTLGSLLDNSATYYGGIACSTCKQHMSDYQLHLVGESTFADEELLASMKVHLEKCKFCKDKFNGMFPEQRITLNTATKPVLMFALQPSLMANQTTALY